MVPIVAPGRRILPLLVALAVSTVSCAPARVRPVPEEQLVIGFILVGAADDLGYNQAVADGAQALARRLPDARVVVVDEVPENDTAIDVLEDLIADEGASLLFTTSFGHRDAARAIAEAHPDVVVAQQSNLEGSPVLDNMGTFFGLDHELLYEAGITAGAATETGRIGFVGSFPIPVIRRNAGAFLLGARSVNPSVVLDVRLTGAWCDPVAQALAATELLAAGADVLGQQQDCTTTVIEAGRDAGAAVVGYHADGSELAGDAWLTAAVWRWDDVYEQIARTVIDGTFTGSVWGGDWRGSLQTDDSPLRLASFGPSVDPATQARVAEVHDRFVAGAAVFVGPLVDVSGTQRLADGEALSKAHLETIDWVPDGVVGDIP